MHFQSRKTHTGGTSSEISQPVKGYREKNKACKKIGGKGKQQKKQKKCVPGACSFRSPQDVQKVFLSQSVK
jgi:hypothetical protein